MSTVNLLSLLPARWKGIGFLVSSETLIQVGQRYIQHQFPGTNLQYMEPHGKTPFNATMPITFSGPTYRSDFLNFQKAMQDPNPGTLYMPTMGVFTNIVAQSADVPIDQSTLGEITFTLTFSVTNPQPSPTQTTTTQEDVFTQGIQVITDTENSFKNNFITPVTANNYQTALSDISSIVGQLQKLSGITTLAVSLSNTIPKLISNPALLAPYLYDPVEGIVALVSNALNGNSQAYTNAKAIATSGNTLSNTMQDINSGFVLKQVGTPQAITINYNIPVWAGTTWEQQQRNNNRYCIVNAFRVAGLVMMCQQAGLQTFTTVQQVQAVINDIQNYYSALIENDTTIFIIQDCKTDLEQLKNNTITVLNSISQQLYSTITMNIDVPISPRQLAYELYGEFMQNGNGWDTFTNILISLNNDQPVHLFSGNITILVI